MPAISTRMTHNAGNFQRQDNCVRTDIRGALMPNVWRSLRPSMRKFKADPGV